MNKYEVLEKAQEYELAYNGLEDYISCSIHASKVDTYGKRNQAGYYLNVLGELVDKATPKKPCNIEECISLLDDEMFRFGWCASCHKRVTNREKYCDVCGQAIDWSEEE